MKKLFSILVAMLAFVGVQAEEKTVWEGSEQISWNNEVAPGTEYQTPDGTFKGLKKGDVIRVYTTTTYDDPQYVMTYRKGDTWKWTDLDMTVSAEGVMSYTVADETIANEISERNLILRGQAYTITKITVDSEGTTDPQPAEGEKTVWEGSEQISWNNEVAPGTEYQTPDGTFKGLKKGDVIRVYTTTTYDAPQYVMTYRKGDNWEWTNLEITVSEEGVMSYTVADETIAKEIVERNLILRGQAYTITKITVTAVSTGISSTVADANKTNGKTYNMGGMEVKGKSGKGIYIKDGKKYVK